MAISIEENDSDRFMLLIVYNDGREKIIADVVKTGYIGDGRLLFYERAGANFKNFVSSYNVRYFGRLADY